MDSWAAAVVPDLPGSGQQPMIWDTASRGLAAAAPGDTATLYACGITPYDATHLGHAATFLAWDLLVRVWRDAGKHVNYVQNVTDVDDPLLERAGRDGEDWRELAAREIALYRSDMTALRVLPPDRYVGAVEAMPLIEAFNRLLADRGSLYELDRDVYFSRAADRAFGSVSGLDTETMIRLCADNGGDPARSGKKDPVDPIVWVGERPGEPSWASEFGPGRPGWHVECAAIATHYLGRTFDVQAGGRDLIFPHHEMSAAHARVALDGTGETPFARHYAHAGMVRLDGEKMSKSRGNLVFVSQLLSEGNDPMAVRLGIISHHYRGDWDWTGDRLIAATERVATWRAAFLEGTQRDETGEGTEAGMRVLTAMRQRLADDLDSPGAIAVVDEWAAAALAGRARGSGPLVRDAIDALIGISL
ncbi:MAG TPA: cysteine--1-D-myo-inosityl 2-amino-2-deoxy-alpha-D-glucopyranoside ligase [Streptosporangiaceae bacterium]|nr:cysteine--1-D-myo-inosityl 2-amino-2-deoxy-alpha-D-glucopyranoside ligase [Streptosporangiaceae bacterium]